MSIDGGFLLTFDSNFGSELSLIRSHNVSVKQPKQTYSPQSQFCLESTKKTPLLSFFHYDNMQSHALPLQLSFCFRSGKI